MDGRIEESKRGDREDREEKDRKDMMDEKNKRHVKENGVPRAELSSR